MNMFINLISSKCKNTVANFLKLDYFINTLNLYITTLSMATKAEISNNMDAAQP